jgi:hypothetical protein
VTEKIVRLEAMRSALTQLAGASAALMARIVTSTAQLQADNVARQRLKSGLRAAQVGSTWSDALRCTGRGLVRVRNPTAKVIGWAMGK